MTQVAAPPSPDRILDSLLGFQLSGVLKGAIELDLFTKIAEGNQNVEELAKACQASEKGVRILCDYLTVRGFLSKSGSRYALLPEADAFLNKKSPMYLGSVSTFLASNEIRSGFDNVPALVRKGGTLKDAGSTEPEHPMWIDFARSMMPMMMLPASLMAAHLSKEPVTKILDIAASHGAFGILIAQQNPSAKLVALDWTNVLNYTRENAERFGVADRFEALAGSAFDIEFGEGYDLVLLPNFLHHFNVEENIKLLRKIKNCLKPGGRVAIAEFVPNEDRISPAFPAMFSMMMLSSTPEGDAYTEAEFKEMIAGAGLTFVERVDLTPSPLTLLVAKNS